MKLIVSTVGTSILTNAAEGPVERQLLANTANAAEHDLLREDREVIQNCTQRAVATLEAWDVQGARRASAEINGILGIYGGNIPAIAARDMHVLIATDTYQGRKTTEIVEDYLNANGVMNVQVYCPKGLSTASTEAFSGGIKNLLNWFDNELNLNGLRDQYEIIFNLVGGFKSLQGYLNTIAMFYGGRISYLFEGEGSAVLSIPRMPIELDVSGLRDHAAPLAIMDTDLVGLSDKDVTGIPELWLDEIAPGKHTLSPWGTLLWHRAKDEILSGDLLPLDCIDYSDALRKDYAAVRESKERVKLQETLARASALLLKGNGNLALLRSDGGLLYETYAGSYSGIDHFRVTLGRRASCEALPNGRLRVRRYGMHDYVNDNP